MSDQPNSDIENLRRKLGNLELKQLEQEKTIAVLTEELSAARRSFTESNARFEAVYDHHYQLTGLLNVDGRLLMANKMALEFAGIEEKDVLGKDFSETPWWSHSSDEQLKLKQAIEVAQSGKSAQIETTHTTADGHRRIIEFRINPVFDQDGKVIYLVPEGYDITEHVQAEEALRESEERYRIFFESSYDAMAIFANGAIVDCNAAAVRSFGCDNADEIVNSHPANFSPDVQPDGQGSMDKAAAMMKLAAENGTHRFEWEHLDKQGRRFPVEVTLTALLPRAGGRFIAVFRNIADRKQAESDRDQLEEQLRQSQKMEAVGQLAGGVAHDFNNLLQGILGFCTIAMEEADRGSQVFDDLDQIQKAGDRATGLVRQLLAFSRKQVLRLETIDLNEVVDDFAKMIQRVLGEHISLKVAPADSPQLTHADRGQLEQIVMNLCVNARDAMPDGGRLTVSTSNQKVTEDMCRERAWAIPGNYVTLAVQDAGCGMDESTQKRIFEPFFTTKGEGQGTGLGLSTVYGIVRQHNGIIDVSTRPGAGSTFTVYLPQSAPSDGAMDKTSRSTVKGGTETILLAEDDEGVREVARQFLERGGYEVISTTNGEEAITAFENLDRKIDLAFLDVVMPVQGGRAVYDHIGRVAPNVPVLFASGFNAGAIHTNFILEQGIALIPKPYTRDDLLDEIRRLLDEQRIK